MLTSAKVIKIQYEIILKKITKIHRKSGLKPRKHQVKLFSWKKRLVTF